jgi:hypothetical protein
MSALHAMAGDFPNAARVAMSRSRPGLPTREQELELHRRLLAGDPVATSDLADAYIEHLMHWISERHPRAPEDLQYDCVEGALFNLMKNPASYNAERLSLVAYLRMSATGDLRNLCKARRRRQAKETACEHVELLTDGRKYCRRSDDPSWVMEMKEEAARADSQILASVRRGLTATEAACLDLLLTGERKTKAFARLLNILDRPAKEQAAEVLRLKDKLTQRIRRAKRTLPARDKSDAFSKDGDA